MDPVFLVAALSGTFSAVMMVNQRNPVYSAVWLLGCFLAVAVAFLQMAAPFLAAIHVLVYTGAILVLFLFVIMLLNLKDEELGEEHPLSVRAACALLCSSLFVLVAQAILRDPAVSKPLPEPVEDFGSVEQIGRLLFNVYALPFELVSLLIMVAMFGAMVLAKKRLWNTE